MPVLSHLPILYLITHNPYTHRCFATCCLLTSSVSDRSPNRTTVEYRVLFFCFFSLLCAGHNWRSGQEVPHREKKTFAENARTHASAYRLRRTERKRATQVRRHFMESRHTCHDNAEFAFFLRPAAPLTPFLALVHAHAVTSHTFLIIRALLATSPGTTYPHAQSHCAKKKGNDLAISPTAHPSRQDCRD